MHFQSKNPVLISFTKKNFTYPISESCHKIMNNILVKVHIFIFSFLVHSGFANCIGSKSNALLKKSRNKYIGLFKLSPIPMGVLASCLCVSLTPQLSTNGRDKEFVDAHIIKDTFRHLRNPSDKVLKPKETFENATPLSPRI